jgi:Protein of unknown function (DUF2631)
MAGMAEHADPHAAAAHAAAAHADAHAEQSAPHRHERPEDWGWHGEFGRWARVAGWLSVGVLLLLNVTTYYNTAQSPWLYGTVVVIILILVRDRFRRKNAWRDTP